MTKYYLVGYDIQNIQSYIFSSRKLKENVSASYLVFNLFNKNLKERLLLKGLIDIHGYKSNSNATGYIISLKGGNAYYLIDNLDLYKEITQETSKDFLLFSRGELSFVTSFIQVSLYNGSSFKEDIKKLQKKISNEKKKTKMNIPSTSILINELDSSSKQPLFCNKNSPDSDQNYKTYPNLIKENYSVSAKKYLSKLLDGSNSQFEFDFDEIANYSINKNSQFYLKEKRKIGLIHVDGNDMGKLKYQFLDKCSDLDYITNLKTFSDLSQKIDEEFKNAFKNMVQDFFKFNKIVQNNKFNVPICPIILNGDDVTFVCHWQYAIMLAESFLKHLKNQISINQEVFKISASAGILITHFKAPFYRAYLLTEEVCHFAKLKARIVDESDLDNWINFLYIPSGLIDSYSILMNQKYNNQNRKNAKKLEKTPLSFQNYNLTNRPYKISKKQLTLNNNTEIRDTLDNVIELKNKMSSNEKWTKTKMSKLERALKSNESDLVLCINELNWRDIDIDIDKIFDLDINNTIYLDAIELLQLYNGDTRNEL